MTEEENTIQTEVQPKKSRGGARPGAGRKKLYADTMFTQRLKCRCEITDTVRACITILNGFSKKRLSNIYPTKLNGEETVRKGAKYKTWTDADAFSTPWSITVNEEYDERIFALAFILENPQYVRINWMNHDGSVQLIWQRTDEIGKLMMTYGNLMARRNRLKSTEQAILDKIPNDGKNYYDLDYLESRLNK